MSNNDETNEVSEGQGKNKVAISFKHIKKIVGFSLIAAPFIGIFTFASILLSFKEALLILLFVAGIVAVVVVGVYLVGGDAENTQDTD